MVYEEKLLVALSSFPCSKWHGTVFRHMFRDYPPDRENTVGARWNPPNVPAIYVSLDVETVLAEVEFQLEQQPIRPVATRTLYKIDVALDKTLDLTDANCLKILGLPGQNISEHSYHFFQEIGGATAFTQHDSLLVPSLRRPGGVNLVIYPNNQSTNYKFDVLAKTEIPAVFDRNNTANLLFN